MPRKALIRCSEFPYHITNRSNNRDFFYIDSEILWAIFMKCFRELAKQYQCRIHGFVLMSNHYHLLISTPRANIGEAMKYLHREVARHVNREAQRTNHFFGGRYKWSVIQDENYYWNAVKYVFRNPIRAGVCDKVHEYAFSSLNKPQDFEWHMTDFFAEPDIHIQLNHDWLNDGSAKEQEQTIQKALRRRIFELPKTNAKERIELDHVPSQRRLRHP